MSQQLQITGGAKVRDLQDVIIGTSGVLSSLAFNVANGVPKLDSNGKILVSQLPNSVMEYQGTWNANTNTPTLVNGTGNQGDFYLCNVAGTTNFGAGPLTFAVGDSAIYSGSIWQKAGGATGTVTSVGLTSTGNDAITITGSPITTSGNINLGFAGTNLQYINGTGDLTTFPTLISSIGLSMPTAFNVSNSPLTANGTIAVTGAGYPSQYIRGDGTLADFPTSGGGGSSVSYYLNGGTSQGTIGGVTYYEMSKIADTGTGVDFPKTGDGLIVSFLTDAGDPAQLNIPAGNWNYEIYASMSSNGGTPQMYAELYVYNGTTFTLISTSSNEILYDGTNLNLYTFAMTVPATTLSLTDRLAVKLYATNSGGKTTTVHTQDSHLCQIITTFSTGITALNGLTAQVQYFATGTSGTDFNISSATATHTFNIPDASASARGLITTGTQTIAGIKTFSGFPQFESTTLYKKVGSPYTNGAGYVSLQFTAFGTDTKLYILDGDSVTYNRLIFKNNIGYDYTFPTATGTLALTSDIPSISGTATYIPVFTGTNSLGNSQIWNNGGIIGMGTSYSSPAFSVVASSGDTTMGRLAVNIGSFSGGSALQVNGGASISADSYITGIRIGLGAGSITSNTILGASSLSFNTTGYENTAVGYATLYSNTTGYDNVGVGYASLNLNTTGSYNISIGSRSLFSNTTGNSNTAIGTSSLNLNTTGSQNTAVGYATLSKSVSQNGNTAFGYTALNNNTASYNTAVGSTSLVTNTTGQFNTALGYASLSSNDTGNCNTGVGSYVLQGNIGGGQNTALGYQSLQSNTSGGANTAIGYQSLQSNTSGTGNIAIGLGALANNTTASHNIGIGYSALAANTTGTQNTSIGYYGLLLNTTGIGNTAMGYGAMQYNTTGSYNTAVGVGALPVNSTSSTNTAIGYAALGNCTGGANIAIGYGAGGGITSGGGNTLIYGGSSITTGSNNTIVGNYAGTSAMANNIVLADGAGNIKYRWDGTNNNLYGNVNFSSTIGNGTYTYTLPSATGTLALTSDLGSYLPLTGGTLTGQLYINPTNTATVGLDVASNTIRFRSDNLEGFKRQLTIGMSSGTVINMIAQGFGGNYGTDMAFYTATTSGVNGTPAMYITGTNNRIGIKTGTPSYDLEVNGSFAAYSASKFFSRVTINGPTDDVDIALQVQAPTGSGKYIMFGRNGSGTAVYSIDSAGNVGAGTGVFSASKAGEIFNVINSRNNSSGDFALVTTLGSNANNTNSYHYIATTGGADKFYVYGNGTILTLSDKRLKKNISKVTDTYLDKVLGLNIVTYNWNDQQDGSTLEFGMIAQEVEKCIPDIVNESRKQENGEIYKGIQVSVLPYILIKAIQEMNTKLDAQNQTIQNLQEQINILAK